MINIVLSLQSKLDKGNKHVLDEIRKLSDAALKLLSDLAVSQQVNKIDWSIWNVNVGQILSTPEGNV